MSHQLSPSTAAQFEGDELWDPSWKESTGEATIRQHLSTDKNDNPNKLTFFASWFCPFVQRSWIALEESGIKYMYVEINPYRVDASEKGGYTKKSLDLVEKQKSYPDFIKASPRGLVPAISHDANNEEVVVWESTVIAEYVDTLFGSSTLIPKDPLERAMVQIWSAHCTDRINKAYYRALMAQDKDKQQQYVEELYKELRALSQAMMQKDGGPYFLGNRFSLVDVSLAPFFQRMLWVGKHYIDLKFPTNDEDFDRIARWWEAVSQRPSVTATMVCKERLISSYSHYSRNIATSDFAKNSVN